MPADPDHFSCCVIWRWMPKQGYDFLVMKYRSLDPNTNLWTDWQIKFSGGMGSGTGENGIALQTMILEIHQETYLFVEKAKQIWKRPVSDGHTKYGFLANLEDCKGSLRTSTLLEDGNELSPPYWFPASSLGRVIFFTHLEPYKKACEELGVIPNGSP